MQELRFYLLLILSLLTFQVKAQNDVIIISSTTELQNIGQFIYFLEDKTGSLMPSEILSPEINAKFEKNSTDIFSRPASSSVFWFKITVQNNTKEALWLNFGDSFSTWEADFYHPNQQGDYTNKIELGALRPQENKFFPSSYYCVPLNLEQSKSNTFYLKIKGDFPKTHHFLVGSGKKMNEHLQFLRSCVMVFVGFLLSILGYNLFIWVSTREKIYLIYVFYLCVAVILVPFDNGRPLFYWSPLWTYHFVFHNVIFIAIGVFAIVYLNMYQIIRKFSYWIMFLLFLLGILFPVFNVLNLIPLVILINPFQLVVLIFYFSLFGGGVYLWVKGVQKARFYIVAWFFVIVSIFIFIFSINGLIPSNIFTTNILYIGFGLEALFFALALGDRLNILKREKEEMHTKNIKLVHEQNDILTQKVEEKTKELNDTNQELLVYNEELQQTQEELSAQRDLLELNNKALETYQTRITKSIQSAQTIQNAILPTSTKIAQDFAEYFILFLPKDVVSGDFYWMAKHQGKLIFIEADCTGHGVSGAFTTLIGNAIFNHVIQIKNILDPAKILENIHQQLQEILQQSETRNLQGMDLSIVVISGSNQEFNIQFGSAGQRLYYSENQALKMIEGSRKKVGGYLKSNAKQSFQTTKFNLKKNAILYLHSDGFIDQHNANRRRFNSQNFHKLLEKIHLLPLSEQKDALLKSLKEHQQKEEQRDDITVIGLKL